MKKKSSRFADLKSIKDRQSDKPETKEEKPVRFKNPDYIQTTCYLQKDVHKKLKIAMAEDEIGFADLIERLVNEWLQARKL